MWCSVTGAYSKRQLSLHTTTVYYYYYHHEKSYLWKRSIFIRRDEIIRRLQITTSGYSTDSERPHHCWATSQNNYGACWMSPLLHNGLRDAPQIAPSPGGPEPPPNTQFLGTIHVHTQNGNSIGWAALARLIALTIRYTEKLVTLHL